MVGVEINGKYLVTSIGILNGVLSGHVVQELEASILGRQPLTCHFQSNAVRVQKHTRVRQVTLSGVDEYDLNFSHVNIGDINPGEMAQLIYQLKQMPVGVSKSDLFGDNSS